MLLDIVDVLINLLVLGCCLGILQRLSKHNGVFSLHFHPQKPDKTKSLKIEHSGYRHR